jgi:hypothetical protein
MDLWILPSQCGLFMQPSSCLTRIDEMTRQWHDRYRGALMKQSRTAANYPTAEEINALPEKFRQYIHDLETRCDKSGGLQTIAPMQTARRPEYRTDDTRRPAPDSSRLVQTRPVHEAGRAGATRMARTRAHQHGISPPTQGPATENRMTRVFPPAGCRVGSRWIIAKVANSPWALLTKVPLDEFQQAIADASWAVYYPSPSCCRS